MSLSKQVVKASSWLILSRLMVNGLSALSIFVMAKLLTPEDFGLVAIASVIATLLQAMVQIPVGQALIKIIEPTNEHFNAAWTINILRTAIMSSLLAAAALPIAYFYEDSRLVMLVLVFALSILISGFSNPKFVLFEKQLNFSYIFINSTVAKFLAIVLSISIAYTTGSYWALVIGAVCIQLLQVSLSYIFYPYFPGFSLSKAREIISFSVWMSLSNIVNNLSSRFDQLIVGKLFGTHVLGSYNVGVTLATLPTKEVSSPLQRALFPAFTHISHDTVRLRAAYKVTLSIFYSVSLPLGFGLSYLAEPLVFLALGQQWMLAATVIELIACAAALGCCASLVKAIAMAQGQTKLLFKRDVCFLILRVTLMTLGVFWMGVIGLLLGRMLATTIIMLLNFQMIRLLIDISVKEQLYAVSRSFISIAIMMLSLHLLVDISLINTSPLDILLSLVLAALIGAMSYIISHFSLWRLQNKPDGIERKLLQAGKNKFRLKNPC